VLQPEKPRYEAGAPVVVHVDGGFSRGSVDRSPARLGRFGFVELAFLFPGGESSPQPDGRVWRSGGEFDFRGANCMRALADVIAFAQGRARSLHGKSIQDVVQGMKVLTDEVGVIGWSMGGNVVAGALGLHGKEISSLKWYASFESPYGEGIINAEFGGRNRPNPFYDADTGKLDLSTLVYGKDIPLRQVLPRPVPGTEELVGILFLDGNRNGSYERDSDYAFTGTLAPQPEKPRLYFSPALTRAARDRKVFGAGWPAHIAGVEDAEKFSNLRSGVPHVPGIVKNVPGLAVIVWATAQDHVQATADYRHIRAQYDAYQAAGVRWIRLNPGAQHMEEAAGKKLPAYWENPPNAKYDRHSIRRAVAPEPPDGPPDALGLAAAACELADRTRRKQW
jgi:hypothetical protein